MNTNYAYLISADASDYEKGWRSGDIVEVLICEGDTILARKKINGVNNERWFLAYQLQSTDIIDVIKAQLEFYATSSIITNDELSVAIANEVKKFIDL